MFVSGDPGQRHLYSVPGSGGNVNCITCNLTMPTSGNECLYNSIDISPDYSYYVQNCQGPDVPETVLRFVLLV